MAVHLLSPHDTHTHTYSLQNSLCSSWERSHPDTLTQLTGAGTKAAPAAWENHIHTCTLVFFTASQALLKWIPCPPSLVKWPLLHLFVLSVSPQPSSCNYFIPPVCLPPLQHVPHSLISCPSILVLMLQLNIYCWNPSRRIARILSFKEASIV